MGAALSLVLSACADTTTQTTPSAIMLAQSDKPIEARAADILAAMTLEEKVGQVIQADIASITPEEVGEYNLGSILNGGNSAPGGGKVADPQAWVDLADAFWIASTDRRDGGLGIPAIWGTDAVHGHNNLQTATIFPHNSALGAANDPALMREIGDVTAREIRATGIDWTFAPTLAVALDDRWGRAYESYSENPDIVPAFAGPLVVGLQG
ncbi:MAG: glycoside hydrolase family 3 N-terminal domain-containing protein, partial [Pseudomonadota bacterium]